MAVATPAPLHGQGISGNRLSIEAQVAMSDGKTLNTDKIQATIDELASSCGETLVVPRGTFLSGALFMKRGVNLHLEKGAVLKCSTDMANFPPLRTRIEGHFEESWSPALSNADGCDGLRITGGARWMETDSRAGIICGNCAGPQTRRILSASPFRAHGFASYRTRRASK